VSSGDARIGELTCVGATIDHDDIVDTFAIRYPRPCGPLAEDGRLSRSDRVSSDGGGQVDVRHRLEGHISTTIRLPHAVLCWDQPHNRVSLELHQQQHTATVNVHAHTKPKC